MNCRKMKFIFLKWMLTCDWFHLTSVDGEWSDWSEWTKCSQVGDDPSVGDCLCRSRSCDNPKPYYGGQPCFGSSVEVANCTGKLTYKLAEFFKLQIYSTLNYAKLIHANQVSLWQNTRILHGSEMQLENSIPRVTVSQHEALSEFFIRTKQLFLLPVDFTFYL